MSRKTWWEVWHESCVAARVGGIVCLRGAQLQPSEAVLGLGSCLAGVQRRQAWERCEGTIEYTLMAPVSRFTHLVGTTLFSLVYGLFHTAVILFTVVVFFDLDLSRANLAAATVILVLGSISFIGLGIMAAILPLLFPERGAQMTNVVQAVLLLVSGIYYPVGAERYAKREGRLSREG